MKSILSKIGIFAILMYGGSSCSVEQDDKGTEPVEKETFEIATIDKLNQNADEINSHKDSLRRSSLEKNARSYIELNEEDLHVAHPCYARIKRMQNGNYIMFYEENEHGGNIHYAISSNLKIWEYRGALLEKTDMIDPADGSAYVRHYSCPEAVVLKNGDILAVAQYRPGLNYRVRGHINGLVTLRSSDNGRTWSKPEDIYQGVNWEPYLLELSNGDIHCYFTDSRRTEIVPKDTGTAMMLSKDGGKTWEPGYGSDPYLVIRSKYEGYVRDEYVHIYGEKKTAYNDQMPVVIQLNDSKELAAVMETARPKSDYDITFAYSGEDGEWDYLAEDQKGPEDRNEKVFHGAGPYIVQFPSGETVMSHGQAYDGTFSIRMGNEKARNFGKEAAIYAGLSHASGDYIGIIDADLQDPPGLLPEMYQMLYWEDWDCVAARRSDRKGEPRLKSFLSDRFYKVLNKLSKIQLVSGARDYRVFGSAPFPGCGYRFAFLYNFLSDDRIYSLSHLDFRRPGTGLAFYGLHHFSGRRDTAFLYGNPGRISGKNIFRDKTPAYLHIKRIQRRKL